MKLCRDAQGCASKINLVWPYLAHVQNKDALTDAEKNLLVWMEMVQTQMQMQEKDTCLHLP